MLYLCQYLKQYNKAGSLIPSLQMKQKQRSSISKVMLVSSRNRFQHMMVLLQFSQFFTMFHYLLASFFKSRRPKYKYYQGNAKVPYPSTLKVTWNSVPPNSGIPAICFNILRQSYTAQNFNTERDLRGQ